MAIIRLDENPNERERLRLEDDLDNLFHQMQCASETGDYLTLSSATEQYELYRRVYRKRYGEHS